MRCTALCRLGELLEKKGKFAQSHGVAYDWCLNQSSNMVRATPGGSLNSRLYSRALCTPSCPTQALRHLAGLTDAGVLRALVDPREFRGLEQLQEATQHYSSGRARGKVVVELK
jgi:NADPH:quinone reductase-like Zn-dependent oxidoreductase